MKDLNVKKPESKRHPVQARKRAFAFLNNKSGEGYVDVAVTVMIVAFVLDFGYSCDGSQLYDATGKVQLGDRIICTVTYQLRMPGFGDFVLPISLKASSSGLSQVYWK